METSVSQEKNQQLVKTFSWILIAISVFVLLGSLLFHRGYSSIITLQGITKNFDPPIGINFTLYFIQNAIELLLCIIVYISATFVLKYDDTWRKILLYGLIASIIFLLISPIINYYNMPTLTIKQPGGVSYISISKTTALIWSYAWSIIFSAFFIFVIVKFSKKEIKQLFK